MPFPDDEEEYPEFLPEDLPENLTDESVPGEEAPMATSPSPAAGPVDDQAILRDYLSRKGYSEDLSRAQKSASTSELYGNLGNAFSGLAQSVSTKPISTAANEGMIKTSQQPVQNVMSQMKNDTAERRSLLSYLNKKSNLAETTRHHGVSEANQKDRNETLGDLADSRLSDANSRQQERIAAAAHQRNVMAVKRDKQLNDLATNSNNLRNSLKTFASSGKIPPQGLADLQNSVIANMGIKGTGGVAERQERYAHSLGIKAADWKQFVTGKMQDVQHSDIAKYFKELAGFEIQNQLAQAKKRAAFATSGNKKMYEKYPDLKSSLDDTVNQLMGQFEDSEGPNQTTANEGAIRTTDASGAMPKPPPGMKAQRNKKTGEVRFVPE